MRRSSTRVDIGLRSSGVLLDLLIFYRTRIHKSILTPLASLLITMSAYVRACIASLLLMSSPRLQICRKRWRK